MIDEINSTELHTCLLEITLLPLAHYWHFWYGPLDVDAMREAASYLVGTHDFKRFATIYDWYIEGKVYINRVDVSVPQTTHGDGGGKKRKNEKTALICKKIGAVFCIG